MANIERFEDIQAWQEARKFAKDIYDVTNKGNITKDYSLRDQIRRASVSVMSNIADKNIVKCLMKKKFLTF